MSLRDTRYGPYVLLPKATPNDCESEDEIIALSNIQNAIARKNDLEKTRAEFVRLSAKSSSRNANTFYSLMTERINEINSEIASFETQISEILDSSILDNVFHKVYSRVIDEDIKALREKKTERQTTSASKNVETTPVSEVVQVVPPKQLEKPVATKPRVFMSMLTAILSFVVFFLAFLVVTLLAGGMIILLSKIPVISTLASWLFLLRGDSPDILIAVLAPSIAYYVTGAMIGKINKERPTIRLSFIFLGVAILLVHIPSLLINLLSGEWFFSNITQAVAGIFFIHKGRAP